MNKDNCVHKILQETLAMNDSNKLTRDELNSFIQKNINETKQTFKITSLCLFKIDINSDQVIDYINQTEDENTYLKNIKQFSKINDIKFNDSLIMFHDINSLIFIFSEIEIPKIIQHGKLKRSNKTRKILEQLTQQKKNKKSKRIL